jgi:CubicO group peptidase (beta-lactamase class C family)
VLLRVLPAWLLCGLAVGFSACVTPVRRSSFDWPADATTLATPETVGLSSAALARAVDDIQHRNLTIHSLTIDRAGHRVLDARFYPYAGGRHDVASVTKSVLSLLIGIAIDRGDLPGVQATLQSFFPNAPVDWSDPRRADIRLEHLLSMTSGFDCGFRFPGEPELDEMRQADQWVHHALQLPMRNQPGERFAYCSPNQHLLSAVLTRATGRSAEDYGRTHLFGPLGIDHLHWPADPQGISIGWGDLQLEPDALARLGSLLLLDGLWRGRPIVSSDWIRASFTPRSSDTTDPGSAYGLGWWILKGDLRGVVEARGRGGQAITLWPDRQLVVVWTGTGHDDRSEIAGELVKAIVADAPLPPDEPGRAALAESLARTTTPPPPSDPPMAPAIAASVSGRRFRLPKNALGILGLRFDFGDASTLRLTRTDGPTTLSLGFDGVPRMSKGPRGLEVALVGRWTSADTLVVDYAETQGPDRFRFRFRFASTDRLEVEVTDPGGYRGALDLVGKAG